MTKPLGPATIKVGTVEVPGRAALAPLAGYTEYPFRAAVARFGCAFAVTPLISAEGLIRRNEKTTRLLATGDDDASVVAAQIFGSRPAAMAEAAKIAAGAGFPIVDVNLGCPAPKIRKQQAGAALLGDAVNLRKVARAVVAASPVPVTAKMRLGDGAGKSTLAAAALYFIPKEKIAKISDYMKTDLPKDAPGNIMKWLAEVDKVFGYVMKEAWCDIGDKDSLKKADEKFTKMEEKRK